MTVAEIKRALLARGYDWTASGYVAAVRAFQAASGLKVDGDAGPKTQAALKAPIAAAPAWSVPGALTPTALRQIAPFARADIVAAVVASAPALQAAGIATPLRLAHFLAQVAHETGGLARLEENLSYSAARLCQVWPKRFPTLASAKTYASNPMALAGKVYGGRLGNRGAADGWTYRGSGGIMTTGRSNYAEAGYEADPDALRRPGPAIAAAIVFWTKRNLNAPADRDDVVAVSLKVNGGTVGLAERKAYLAAAKRAIRA